MTELFRRACVVTVDRLRLNGLDVDFEIKKALRREPNTCELNIYNLSADHRRQLEQLERVRVTVEAGYGEETSQIFFGDLREVFSTRDGADIVTKVSSGDGHRAHRGARVARSFSPGATLGQVLTDVAGAFGVGEGNVREVLARVGFEGGGNSFSEGVTVSGSAADEMDSLCASAGLEWSIQDQRLQLLERGRALRGTALRLTSGTGLVGTPTISSAGVLKAQTLLVPDLFPGRLVQMESEFVRGLFRVEKCEYKGATRGGDWFVSFEAKEPRS